MLQNVKYIYREDFLCLPGFDTKQKEEKKKQQTVELHYSEKFCKRKDLESKPELH